MRSQGPQKFPLGGAGPILSLEEKESLLFLTSGWESLVWGICIHWVYWWERTVQASVGQFGFFPGRAWHALRLNCPLPPPMDSLESDGWLSWRRVLGAGNSQTGQICLSGRFCAVQGCFPLGHLIPQQHLPQPDSPAGGSREAHQAAWIQKQKPTCQGNHSLEK